MAGRKYEIVVWGATGFTGKLVCEHLAQHYEGKLRWAMAGRNRSKLENTRADIAARLSSCKEVPILIADVADPDTMIKVTKSTKVLLSTAGPYLQTGTQVVDACIKTGTHYADINAELAWMKNVIASHHEAAAKAGVKIVLCCGWDCIPADLGTLLLAEHAKSAYNRKLSKVTNMITAIVGHFSGGSLNTALSFYAHPLEGLFPHPYSLNPPDARQGKDGRQYLGPGYEPNSQLFTSPSFFAPANLRIVRRSNALLGYAYGKDFCFNEAFGHTNLLTALFTTVGLWFWGALLLLAARVSLFTAWLKRFSAKPGEGPSRKMLLGGRWECQVVGITEEQNGDARQVLRAVLKGEGDPGYWQTSRMLLEAGICLANGDCSPFCLKGGILTPASALGLPLVERLRAAGICFDIKDQASKA